MRYFSRREPRVLWRATCIGLFVALLAGAPSIVEAELYLRVDHSGTAEYDVLVIDQDFGVVSLGDNMLAADLGLFSTSSLSPTANADELLSLSETASTYSSTHADLYAQQGAIGFSGAVGDFQMNVTTGFSAPLLGSEGRMDLFNVSFSGGSGSLTIELWDTGFETLGDDTRFQTLLGGTTDGLLEIATYADSDANAFGTEYLLASGIFDGSATGNGIAFSSDQTIDLSVQELVGDYAMGIRATITHSFGDVTSFDVDLQSGSAVPEPASALMAILVVLGCGLCRLPRRRCR
jgi:hypothetical protein